MPRRSRGWGPGTLPSGRGRRGLFGRRGPGLNGLCAAAASHNPELARRARVILEDLIYGLSPQTPAPVVEALGQYRSGGGREQKSAAADALAGRGIAGSRVLLRLRRLEPDEALRQHIDGLLTAHPHDPAMALIAEGDFAGAEMLLKGGSGDEAGARDYAAFLLRRGTLKQAIESLGQRLRGPSGQPLNAADAPLLCAMCRADGDLAGAMRGADRRRRGARRIAARRAVRLEGAARRRRGGRKRPIRSRTWDFAPPSAGCPGIGRVWRRRLAALPAIADRQNDDAAVSAAATALFLNGRPDAAVGALTAHGHFAEAAEFLAPRMRFEQALALPKQAAEADPRVAADARPHGGDADIPGRRRRGRRGAGHSGRRQSEA